MSSRRILKTMLLVLGSVAALAVATLGATGVYAYYGARSALSAALSAKADNLPLPDDVLLDTHHFSQYMSEPGRLSALLRTGFELKEGAMFWDMLPQLASAHIIAVESNIDMVCEVYRRERWSIYCGQLKCDAPDPCIFQTREGGTFKLVTEPEAKAD